MYNETMIVTRKNINQPSGRNGESGNALWFLLLAIVLLSALTLAITGSSDTTEQSGDVEQARVKASDIMRFAKGVEQAVTKMTMRGLSENDLSFETTGLADHANGNCTDNSCLVFHREGGGMAYKKPTVNINDGTHWIFTGSNNVTGTGTSAADLVMILPNIDSATCTHLNRMLNVSPAGTDNTVDFTPYDGTFNENQTIENMNGARTGCQDNAGAVHDTFFYHVILRR